MNNSCGLHINDFSFKPVRCLVKLTCKIAIINVTYIGYKKTIFQIIVGFFITSRSALLDLIVSYFFYVIC